MVADLSRGFPCSSPGSSACTSPCPTYRSFLAESRFEEPDAEQSPIFTNLFPNDIEQRVSRLEDTVAALHAEISGSTRTFKEIAMTEVAEEVRNSLSELREVTSEVQALNGERHQPSDARTAYTELDKLRASVQEELRACVSLELDDVRAHVEELKARGEEMLKRVARQEMFFAEVFQTDDTKGAYGRSRASPSQPSAEPCSPAEPRSPAARPTRPSHRAMFAEHSPTPLAPSSPKAPRRSLLASASGASECPDAGGEGTYGSNDSVHLPAPRSLLLRRARRMWAETGAHCEPGLVKVEPHAQVQSDIWAPISRAEGAATPVAVA